MLTHVMAQATEAWQLVTTKNNLQTINEARASRGGDIQWLTKIIHDLKDAEQKMSAL